MEETVIKVKDKVVKIKAGQGYTEPGRSLCKVKDTGNGYISKFYSWSNCDQDNYVCLDYAEAEYLVAGLTELMKQWKEKHND